jgi:tRNA G18 (ribose-2'-O)-methylase SpoU
VGTPIAISTIDDPRLEPYRNVRDKDLRGRGRLFMAESEMVIRRLLRTPQRLHSLLLSPKKHERLREALAALPEGAAVYVADLGLMCEIAGFHIHRGALAAGFRPRPMETTLDAVIGPLRRAAEATLLLAESVTNVDNMGQLFRNAAAFGVDAIVLDPTCCDPLYRKAIRVSMGHVLSVPWAVSEDWPADLARLKREWGVTLIGAETLPGARPLWELPRIERLGLVFGAEGHGLSRMALDECEAVFQAPMRPGVPSLNVATASAVFLYERCRVRGLARGPHSA